jgi:hypothetical protein
VKKASITEAKNTLDDRLAGAARKEGFVLVEA